MTLKSGLKKSRLIPLYDIKVNKLRTEILIVYIDDMLAIGEKISLVNIIGCIKREYVNKSIFELEDFIGCTIEFDLTKMTLKISQPDLITMMTQGFNKDLKSLITFNTHINHISRLYLIKK